MGELLGEFLRPAPSMLTPHDSALATVERAAATESPALAPELAPGPAPAPRGLKILHVLRAPLGGLFRHVLDVAQGQAERGHRVGLIVDSLTGGPRAAAVLEELAPQLALGVERVAMTRQLSIGDTTALRLVARRISALEPDVLHGHGAKGAALVRLVPRAAGAIRVYTPHGGSLVYAPGTLAGGFYRALERLLSARTNLFLFESSYIAEQFRKKIGAPRALVRIVRNGVGEAEFAPVATRPDATDLISVGELRSVKGFDVLIEALAALKRSGRRVSATIAGDGPDGAQLKELTERLGIADQVRFVGHQPARAAFAMGRILVVPSRAESLPYIVLEAAAAGIPIVASRVGGIPEIFGARSDRLIPADSVTALADAIAAALDDPEELHQIAQAVTARVRDEFSVNAMVDGGLAAYCEALSL
jgi:glycosyltransferase involved in cell wall biosynthesis